MTGYGITIIPMSWAIGVWKKSHKTVIAFGPLRFSHHKGLPKWKKRRPKQTKPEPAV